MNFNAESSVCVRCHWLYGDISSIDLQLVAHGTSSQRPTARSQFT